MPRHLRVKTTGMLAAVAIAGAGCAANTASGGPATERARAQPGRFQCGTTIAGPASPSSPHDPVRLAVTAVKHTQDSITVSYAISSPHRNQILPLPIEPTPPTALLLRDNVITAIQATTPKPLPPGTVNGQAPEGYLLGKKPYRGQLTLHRLCPGARWQHIWPNPRRYQIGIAMTSQPPPSASTQPAAVPLTVAFVTLDPSRM